MPTGFCRSAPCYRAVKKSHLCFFKVFVFAWAEWISCFKPALLQTQVLYRWVEPKICVENITGAVELPATGQREPCPPCNPGYYNSNDSTCLPCPPGTHSDGTYGKPAHTYPHRPHPGVDKILICFHQSKHLYRFHCFVFIQELVSDTYKCFRKAFKV